MFPVGPSYIRAPRPNARYKEFTNFSHKIFFNTSIVVELLKINIYIWFNDWEIVMNQKFPVSGIF